MGGSGWSYTVAYQPDIAAVLRQVRQDVYDRGQYYREPSSVGYAGVTEEEFRAGLDPDGWESGINDAVLEDFLDALRRPVPRDPDTLLAAQPHSGTHSIIDMSRGVSDTPRMLTVSPPSEEELLEAFGTLRPTAAQISETRADITFGRSGWIGTYLVIYVDDVPTEIRFYGSSGD